jgi:hypothetical protein
VYSVPHNNQNYDAPTPDYVITSDALLFPTLSNPHNASDILIQITPRFELLVRDPIQYLSQL